MSLELLIKKRRLNILGMNSGTSADGLDFALMQVNRTGRDMRYRFMHGSRKAYPRQLREAVLEASQTTQSPPETFVWLDQALGIHIGRQARTYLKRLNRKGLKVDAIASHGQTVRHLPASTEFSGLKVRGTLQLGNLARIAAEMPLRQTAG